jgi:hypothetical protein
MATPEEIRAAIDEIFSAGVRRGLLHNDVEDDVLDGRHITVHGQRLVNFGQQLLLQALRSARRHGARRVFYGMSAGLHKARFGARREQRWAYIQPTET